MVVRLPMTSSGKRIPYTFVDDWYDFKIYDEKVEVKSCQFTVRRNGSKKPFSTGRFDFTSKLSRELQYSWNIWVCFIVRHENQFIIYGFIRAKELKQRRYFSVHQLRDLPMISLDDWIKKLKRGGKKENGKKIIFSNKIIRNRREES